MWGLNILYSLKFLLNQLFYHTFTLALHLPQRNLHHLLEARLCPHNFEYVERVGNLVRVSWATKLCLFGMTEVDMILSKYGWVQTWESIFEGGCINSILFKVPEIQDQIARIARMNCQDLIAKTRPQSTSSKSAFARVFDRSPRTLWQEKTIRLRFVGERVFLGWFGWLCWPVEDLKIWGGKLIFLF